MTDAVNHPPHYNRHPSGVECIAVTEHMNFNLGNAVKYIWRADHKNGLEDLRKARWYIDREIARLEKAQAEATARARRVPRYEDAEEAARPEGWPGPGSLVPMATTSPYANEWLYLLGFLCAAVVAALVVGVYLFW